MTINISLILLATCRMWRIKVGYNTALNGAGPSLSRLLSERLAWLRHRSDTDPRCMQTRPAHQPTLFSFLLSQQIILIYYVVGRAAYKCAFIPRTLYLCDAVGLRHASVSSWAHTKLYGVHEKCAPRGAELTFQTLSIIRKLAPGKSSELPWLPVTYWINAIEVLLI